MAYGKGMVKSDAISQRKELAGAKMSGNFGCGSFPARAGSNGQGSRSDTLPDGARGPGIGAKGVMQQAAPDHGAPGVDHFSRAGKV